MKARLLWLLAISGVAVGFAASRAPADQSSGNAEDKAAIQKNAAAFVEAFHRGDAKAIAVLWTTDGEYTDQTGRHMKGRENLEKAFEGFLAENKGLKVRIESESIRFITPDVAIEKGVSEVLSPDGSPPSRARYTNVHVKKDGQWFLSSVEDAAYTPPSNIEHMRDLSWALGDWMSDPSKPQAEHLSVTWADTHNFIIAKHTTSARGVAVAGATQWIGWDPLAKNFHSWMFDAAGGYGEGTWGKEGDKWLLKKTAVLQDGKKEAMTIVIGQVDPETITLQLKDHTLDGQSIADTPELKLTRVKD
jgi:uncharacterized protein (TIGR02246 family)